MSDNSLVQMIASSDPNQIEELTNNKEISSAKSQMKMFIIAQAKLQLQKIIDLNDKLDSWISVYTKRVDEEMNNPNITPDRIAQYMTQMTDMIDRSFNMIKEVVSDEKLLNLMCVNVSNTTTNINSNDSSNIQIDSRSRARIRDAVNLVLDYINNNEESIVIESTSES